LLDQGGNKKPDCATLLSLEVCPSKRNVAAGLTAAAVRLTIALANAIRHNYGILSWAVANKPASNLTRTSLEPSKVWP